ncbi:hypothetical protein EDD17DRAFT_1758730 [Pisolithus thermaeus]|nr:hypothetical protein EV401DRAFT_2066810 [Pisolithus croceorrhizus]KAI6161632.1 hypothetical protein EDD17DRAFT_1758730 [Pisolithus thermaeus]
MNVFTSHFVSRHTERPMKIEIVIDPARPAPQSLASRVAPATAAAVAPVRAARPATRGRRGPKSRRKTTERPQKSVADLDAEMEDYTASNGPTAAPAVTA